MSRIPARCRICLAGLELLRKELEQLAAQEKRRRIGFTADAEGTSLANSLAVYELDREPDTFQDPPDERKRR